MFNHFLNGTTSTTTITDETDTLHARPIRADMATYVVTSHDFGGSSAVRVHVVTDQLNLARRVYASVLDACDPPPRCADTPRQLVELTRVARDTPLLGDGAPILFWGGDAAAVCNNNTNTNDDAPDARLERGSA